MKSNFLTLLLTIAGTLCLWQVSWAQQYEDRSRPPLSSNFLPYGPRELASNKTRWTSTFVFEPEHRPLKRHQHGGRSSIKQRREWQVECGLANRGSLLAGSQDHQGSIDGQDVSEGDFPWYVKIEVKGDRGWEHCCSGTSISSTDVITTAACFYKNTILDKYRLVFNYWNAHQPQNTLIITFDRNQVLIHPQFNATNEELPGDVAIVKIGDITSHPDFEYISSTWKPICLPTVDEEYFAECYLPGLDLAEWQSVNGDWQCAESVADNLKCVELVLIRCPANSLKFDDMTKSVDAQICAIAPYSNLCPGDAGLAMQCIRADGAWRMEGISSINHPGPKKIQIFENVRYYIDWIQEMMAI